jgi:hypothetical protein
MTPPADLDPLQDPRFGALLDQLRAQDAPEPSSGFTDRVMDTRPRPGRTRLSPATIGLRAAAAVALLMSISIIYSTRYRCDEPIPQALPVEILMAIQRADGGWSADEQNLRPRYDVGVSALAVLALIHADSAAPNGRRWLAIQAGMDHLIQRQSPDGRFGPDFSGSDFTHYLATKAVESAAHLPAADPAWAVAALRAKTHLPAGIDMANLNQQLANPAAFPTRWADAGGPAAHAALQLLQR